MKPLPPILPHYHVSLHNEDDFVRDTATVLLGGQPPLVAERTTDYSDPVPLSPSAATRPPVLTLDQIKQHCHIEPDQTVDDALLTDYERAARIHTEMMLRRPGELDENAPENIKTAMLVLIAHWYRNREAVGAEGLAQLPLAYAALLSTERQYNRDY